MIKKIVLIAALCSWVLTACTSGAMENGVVSIWGGDVSLPKMISLIPISEHEISVSFTAPITVSRAAAILPDDPETEIPVTWKEVLASKDIVFLLGESVGIGNRAALSATVIDGRGNSLSFSMPFTGFNSRPPVLRINEVRTEYSKPKVEYIELFVVQEGNLGGVELTNAMNTVRPFYEFPAVEVLAGDFIVYHLRSVEEGLVDEIALRDESPGIDARSSARDFWDTLTSAPLKKTNVLLLKNRKGGQLLDALLLCEEGRTEWPNETVRLAAEEAALAGAWLPGPLVEDAFCSTGTTVTRTIGRNPFSADTELSGDWKISATSKCSPGATNAPH